MVKMKTGLWKKCAAVLLFSFTLSCQNLFAREAEASISEHVGLSSGQVYNEADQTMPVIFIDGELVAAGMSMNADGGVESIGYDYVIENDTLYVHPKLIEDKLNVEINVSEEKYPMALRYGVSYVALRPVAEELGMTVSYAESMSPPWAYYYESTMPVSPANTIIRNRPNIIIDKPYDGGMISKEDAMEKTKAVCLEALAEVRRKIEADAPHLAEDFDGIAEEINRMLYIGEVSCFYKFTIGPYDVLYDKYSGKVFFIIHSSSTIIKEVDVNNTKGLYIPVFIVG